MEKKLAKFISYLLHPLLIPTYGMLLLLNLDTYVAFVIPQPFKIVIYSVTFVCTFVLPVTATLFMIGSGHLKNMHMRSRHSRRIPFLYTAVFYMIAYYVLNSLFTIPTPVNLFLIGANICIFIALLINAKWKVSAHAIGVGGLLGMLVGLSMRLYIDLLPLIIVAVLCCGLVGFARLALRAHRPAQVYVGLLVGLLGQLVLFVLV